MFESTNDIQQPRLAVFLYGPPGAGKTRQAATFPAPVVLSPSNENGVLTLRGMDVQYRRLTTPDDLDAAVSYLERVQAKDGPDALPGETLVIDAVSHYSELLIEHIAKSRKAGMDQQGWGLVAAHFRALHQRLRRLDMHIVYTALSEPLLSEGGGVIGQRPRLGGSARDLIPSACDLLLYMEARESTTREGVYKAYSRPRAGAIARTRLSALPPEMDLGVDEATSLWAHIERAL